MAPQNTLTQRELIELHQAADAAIHAANRLYTPFLKAIAHPLKMQAVVDLAKIWLERPTDEEQNASATPRHPLTHRELVLLRRATEDAIYSADSHHASFLDLFAHPLNMRSLVDMAQAGFNLGKA